MNSDKDYYAILGVLPSAEDIIIRAAYRALAQRYHPDRAQASDSNVSRMADINEAYRVLSDPTLRKNYDAQKMSSSNQGQPEYQDFGDESPSAPDPLEKDWNLAKRFYPDLDNLNTRLEKVSWRLASAFRATLLESKAFEKRASVAASMERGFLERYFGKNPTIIDFASRLIQASHRQAAKDLNEAIRVLGDKSSPKLIIDAITSTHANILRPAFFLLIDQIENDNATFYCYEELIKAVGGTINPAGGIFNFRYDINLHGKHFQIKNWSYLRQWYIDNVIPLSKA